MPHPQRPPRGPVAKPPAAALNFPAADFPRSAGAGGLLLKYLLDRPLAWAPDQHIVYRDLKTLTYRTFFERVQRLAHVLAGLGVRYGDRVGVLEYDSHRYLELYFAVPMLGAVLHTVNTYLAPDQIAFTLAHAEDKVLFLNADFVPLLQQLEPHLSSVRSRILLADSPIAAKPPGAFAGEYESLLASAPRQFSFPDFDENTVATLFYTTGTTGDPKGVFFTHRQLLLHTFVVGFTLAAHREPADLNTRDVYLPLTPMFHVHSWGVPYIATALGLKQVYPGRYQPDTLAELIVRHRPTLSHGVPTVLRNLVQNPAFAELDLSGLKMLIGGSALTQDLARAAQRRGIQVMAGYGMSETCPVVTVAHVRPATVSEGEEAVTEAVTRAGVPLPMVRARALDAEGLPLPPGRQHSGEIVLQSPWLTQGYFKNPEQSEHLWRDGWLHTGDIGYIDPEGYVRITDRLKDVIKAGGEWISSLELENALAQHETVAEVAVVGVPDPKWGECPHAEVVLRERRSGEVSPADLLAHLRKFIKRGAIHKRAILTRIHLVQMLPRTSVGKLDKKALRAQVGRALAETAPRRLSEA